jgi:hypothetical protein
MFLGLARPGVLANRILHTLSACISNSGAIKPTVQLCWQTSFEFRELFFSFAKNLLSHAELKNDFVLSPPLPANSYIFLKTDPL